MNLIDCVVLVLDYRSDTIILLSPFRRKKGATGTVRSDQLRRDAAEDAVHAREDVHETQGAGLPWIGHHPGEGQDDPY